jgi:hypothetical protein
MAGGGVYWDDAAKSLAAFAERAGFVFGTAPQRLTTDHPNAFFQTRGWRRTPTSCSCSGPRSTPSGLRPPPTFAEDARSR